MKKLMIILFATTLTGSAFGQEDSVATQKKLLDSLVKTIDDNYDMLHTDYTPSVYKLSELGIPAIEAVIPLLDNTRADTRLHAQRVVEGVIYRMNGFIPGQGFTIKEGEAKVKSILNSINYNWADTVIEERHKSIEHLKNWVIGQNKTETVKNIEKKYKAINKETGYQKVVLKNEEFLDTVFIKQLGKGYGQLTGFFKNDTIYKICEQIGVRISHDSFTTDYYFFEGKLIFIYEKYEKEEEKGFVENSFIESDGSIGYRTPSLPFEGQYYFDNDKLINTETKGEIETMLLPNEKFFDSQTKEGQLLLSVKKHIDLLTKKYNSKLK